MHLKQNRLTEASYSASGDLGREKTWHSNALGQRPAAPTDRHLRENRNGNPRRHAALGLVREKQ